MARKLHQALVFVLFTCAAACLKDKPATVTNELPPAGRNVYVICEGNFNSHYASLYAYQPGRDSVFGDLYAAANGQVMGDVMESMQHIGDQLFLCVNNSSEVAVVSATDWKLAGTIAISMPRYLLPISATKAYVSSEYSRSVCVINPASMTVTGTIVMPDAGTEGMCLVNGTAFVCCWDTACTHLYKIDVATDKIVQSIPLPAHAPQEVWLDKEQMLWVLAGDQPYKYAASLIRLDPSNGEILARYQFPADADPVKPVMNGARDTIYYLEAYNTGMLGNGIFRMGIHEAALPAQPFIAAHANQYLWALGVDPMSGDIYEGDAKDFSQKGTVYVYGKDGVPKSSFNVGPGPGHFYFDY